MTLTFILLESKEVVVINTRIKFGPSRFLEKKQKQTLTLTALIVSFKSFLWGRRIELHENVPCFEKPSCKTSRP